MSKQLTYAQVESRKQKAEDFLRNVIGDEDRAGEVADESVQDYADRRHFDIVDDPQKRRVKMANGDSRTKQDLINELDDLRAENQDLQDALSAIADIVVPEDDDGDEGDDQDQ